MLSYQLQTDQCVAVTLSDWRRFCCIQCVKLRLKSREKHAVLESSLDEFVVICALTILTFDLQQAASQLLVVDNECCNFELNSNQI